MGGKTLWVVSTSALLLGVPWALAYSEEQMIVEQERAELMQQRAQNEVRGYQSSLLPSKMVYLELLLIFFCELVHGSWYTDARPAARREASFVKRTTRLRDFCASTTMSPADIGAHFLSHMFYYRGSGTSGAWEGIHTCCT